MLQRRILIAILMPVVGIGIVIAGLSYFLLVTPLVQWLTSQSEHHLTHAVDMAISICDERFSDLIDLRLEGDPEMLQSLRKEALSQIMSIHDSLPQLQILVVDENRQVLGATFPIIGPSRLDADIETFHDKVEKRMLWEQPARVNHRYFPFWRWHILGVIFDKDFNIAINRATRVVTFGTFGVLLVVLASASLFFYLRVNRPLKNIIRAAQSVSQGNLKPVKIHRPDEIGQVTLAFNNMVDSLQTEKKKTRRIMSELHDSEEHYRVLTENSLALVGMVQKGRFIYANQCALDTFGHSSESFQGTRAVDVIHPEDRSRVFNKISSIETGLVARTHLEFRCLKRSGEVLWLESIATLVLVKEQHAVLIHAIDVTLRKQESLKRRGLEEKLARAQKMEAIGMLAGGVAHDLNNVLGGLVSYPELLLMDLPVDSSMRDPLTTIHQSGLRAAAIVQDLLTLSRRGVAIAEVISLNPLVQDYLDSPEHEKLTSFHPNIVFEANLDQTLGQVKGSPEHLSKTLMNLVSNAAEAMPSGGSVTIRTEVKELAVPLQGYEWVENGTYSVLSVIDKGIGIRDEDLIHIFEPFYTKKAMGRRGTGLGMAVVWGTIKDHGGYIDVTSAPGQGTRIDLYFPVTASEPAVSASPQAKSIALSGSETILVVDDVEEQLMIAMQMLTQLGYKVHTVTSGEEAVSFLQTRRVDLVVLDMIMDPGMDGLETYRHIMRLHPGQKAIITSGYSETERVIEAQRLGVGAYVKKPYVLKTLGTAVRNELDRRS
jgi:two-component system cell cycle sensor histidine kinase/response regulator CckA